MGPDINWTRWAFYFAVGPPALLALFAIRSRSFRVVLLLAVLVFVESVFLSWRPLGFVAFSLSSAMAYTMFASFLTVPDARRRMFALGGPWLLFLLTALMAVPIGSESRISSFGINLVYWQAYYFEGLLFYCVGRAAFRTGEECEDALHWIVYMGAGAALLHFFCLATGYTFYTIGGYEIVQGTDLAWRYGGLFQNPNSMADFYAVVLPIALVCRVGWSRPKPRTGLLIALSAAMMVGSLALTASRGGAAAAIGALALGVLLMPIRLGSAMAGLLFAFFTIVVALMTVTHVLQGGLELTLLRFEGLGTDDMRYGIWARTIESIIHHPFGIGLDPYIYGDRLQLGVNGAHNIYLEMASQAGVLGLVGFLWVVLGSLRRAWIGRRLGDAHAKTASTALIVGLLGFLMGGMLEPIFHNGFKFQRIFWVLLGIASSAPAWASARSSAGEPALRDAEAGFGTDLPSEGAPSLVPTGARFGMPDELAPGGQVGRAAD